MYAKCTSWIKSASLSLLVLSAGIAQPAFADQTPRLTDLGTLAYDGTFPTSTPPNSCINAAGQIIGQAGLGTWDAAVGFVHHAFLYSKGIRIDIPPAYGGVNTTPIALNDCGQALIQSSDGTSFVYYNGNTFKIKPVQNGLGSTGVAINANGQVIGSSSLLNSASHGFLWDSLHGTRDLGTLNPTPGAPGQFLGSSAAVAINRSGLVTGTADTPDLDIYGSTVQHAFVFDGAIHDLGTLSPDPTQHGHFLGQSTAIAINAFGQITGTADTSQTNEYGGVLGHAFIWGPLMGMRDLGTLWPDPANRGQCLGASTALAINIRGQVIGVSDVIGPDGYPTTHAFLWTPFGWDGVPGNPQMKDLGVLGGFVSAPTGLNDNGQVIGVSDTANYTQHAFLYSGGVMQDLTPQYPFGNSTAAAINAWGQVVGNFDVPDGLGGVASHPFRFYGRTFTDLGTLGGIVSNVDGLNDFGQIAGHSSTGGPAPDPFHAWITGPY